VRRVVPVASAALAALAVLGADGHTQRHQIHWRDCHTRTTPERLQCATVRVLLNWTDPHGPTIELALNRLPALDPAHRIGVLITNPGGPGGSGVDDVAEEGAGPGPEFDILHERFDLIGLDPRGVGHSAPVRCPTPARDSSASAFPTTEADYNRLVKANRRAGEACASLTGPLIYHVDTVSAARDIDAVRADLGENQVSLLGGSYGTELFAVYASLFPGRTRAAVLDGAVDHTRPTWQSAQDEAAATEDEFARFADWCAGDPTCPLSRREALDGFEGLAERADRGGVQARGRSISGALATKAVYDLLYRRDQWLELARRLRAAVDPKKPDVDALLGPELAPDPEEAAYIAVGCHDFPSEITGLPDLVEKVRTLRRIAPRMWRYSEFWTWSTTCLGWPIPPVNPPAPSRVDDSPPILVIDCEHDPATPIAWAVSLASQFDKARLSIVDCDGHTAAPHSAAGRMIEAEFLTHSQ
jgi:pimeloyl-ACP methyl ester carboxylesterase